MPYVHNCYLFTLLHIDVLEVPIPLPLASYHGTKGESHGNTFTDIKFDIQIDRQPGCKGTDAKDDTGHKTLAGFPWYAGAFWGCKTEEVPGNR